MTHYPAIIDRYERLSAELSSYDAQLLAVSKRQPMDRVRALVDIGHTLFAENRVADFLQRQADFDDAEIDWHFIGTLQSKKANKVSGIPACIQSVDRLKLAQLINSQCAATGQRQRVLLQFKVAQEEEKQGYDLDTFLTEYDQGAWDDLTNLDVAGIMGMATFTDDHMLIRKEYRMLHGIFSRLRTTHFDQPTFHTLSMGMSSDYRIALDEGATMIRVGSLLFGARDYDT